MTVQDTQELFNEGGSLPVWGHNSASGKPYYTFQLTPKDKYIFFPTISNNPTAPKFQLRKVESDHPIGDAE